MSQPNQPTEQFTYMMLTHTNGDQCIWLDGYWFVPLDAGGEGHPCPHDHPFAAGDTTTPVPQGTTVTEWAVQYAPHAPLNERPPYMFEKTPLWTEQTARAEARVRTATPRRLYRRQRTTYPEQVTDWEQVNPDAADTTPQHDRPCTACDNGYPPSACTPGCGCGAC